MAGAIPFIKAIWPFLREYVLNGQGVKESWKTNKKRVILLGLITGMAFIIALGYSHVQDLVKEISTLKNSYEFRTIRDLRSELNVLHLEKDKMQKRIDELQKMTPTAIDPVAPVTIEEKPIKEVIPIDPPKHTPMPEPKKQQNPLIVPNREEDYDRVKSYQDFLDGLNRR